MTKWIVGLALLAALLTVQPPSDAVADRPDRLSMERARKALKRYYGAQQRVCWRLGGRQIQCRERVPVVAYSEGEVIGSGVEVCVVRVAQSRELQVKTLRCRGGAAAEFEF